MDQTRKRAAGLFLRQQTCMELHISIDIILSDLTKLLLNDFNKNLYYLQHLCVKLVSPFNVILHIIFVFALKRSYCISTSLHSGRHIKLLMLLLTSFTWNLSAYLLADGLGFQNAD